MAACATSTVCCTPSVLAWGGETFPSLLSRPASSSSGRNADTPAQTTSVSRPFHSKPRKPCGGSVSLNLKGPNSCTVRPTFFQFLPQRYHVLRVGEVGDHGEGISAASTVTAWSANGRPRMKARAFVRDCIEFAFPASHDAYTSTCCRVLVSHRAADTARGTDD